jgi:hypothetical protein
MTVINIANKTELDKSVLYNLSTSNFRGPFPPTSSFPETPESGWFCDFVMIVIIDPLMVFNKSLEID